VRLSLFRSQRHARPLDALAAAARGLGIALVTAIAVASPACGNDEDRACRVGADCASGQCGADGTCVPPNGASPDGGAPSGSSGGDAGARDASSDASSDAALPGCTPNKDGTIAREEIPIKAGLKATYRVAQDETVSTAGTPSAGGRRAWDFSSALPSDTTVILETQALSGKWYASDFPSGTYAAKLREGTDLVGVFETTPTTLAMQGVVSSTDGFTSTKLKNDPPVAVLSFPLKLSSKWTTDTTVSGTLNGIPGAYTEKYVSEIDAEGTLKTPLGTFDVLRVKTTLTRTQGFLVTTVRTFAFVTECYGTVATVTSKDNEQEAEFTRALELRRIAP
jgi:hypothetical protein